jgi:DNA polymerase (family 10)
MNVKTKQPNKYEFELFKQYSSHDILPISNQWKTLIHERTSAINVEITGELRRGRSSLNHIDLVVCTNDIPQTISEITALPGILSFIKKTNYSIEIRLKNDIPALVWLATPSEFATALLFSTGPNSHTDWLNSIALNSSKHISFQGCWNNKNLVNLGTEAKIYRFLSLPYFPPEVRETAIAQEDIVNLYFKNMISHDDIRSDLHTHSNWSDGKNSIEDMVKAAIDRNLSTIAITDHSPLVLKPRYPGADYFISQHSEIDRIIEIFGHQINILKGVEVDILPDGSLDLPPEILQTMDIVIASLHVQLDQPRSIITNRLIRAIENPFVDIIGHPGGRLYPMHDIADLDWNRIYHAAAFHQTALEINSHKAHPLFDDQKVRAAIDAGAPICLNSDAHSTSMLAQSIFGINIARRAGLEKDQVINTWSSTRLLSWLKTKKRYCNAAVNNWLWKASSIC